MRHQQPAPLLPVLPPHPPLPPPPTTRRAAQSGCIPLHEAAYWNGSLEVVQALLAARADVHLRDRHKCTPLHSTTACICMRTLLHTAHVNATCAC